jgi:ketosteroid isomerase-like protein
MMPGIFAASFVLLLGALAAPKVQGAPNATAEIRGVMAGQVAAWNRGDIDGFMDGYARSAKTEFVSGDKITRGWQTVRDNYRRKYSSREKMGSLKFSELEVTVLSADAAMVLGRWQLVRKADKPHGTFTLLFRRTPAGWRIVHDHTS